MKQFVEKEKKIVEAIQIADITPRVLADIGKEKGRNISIEYLTCDDWLTISSGSFNSTVYITDWLIFKFNGSIEVEVDAAFNSRFESKYKNDHNTKI